MNNSKGDLNDQSPVTRRSGQRRLPKTDSYEYQLYFPGHFSLNINIAVKRVNSQQQ